MFNERRAFKERGHLATSEQRPTWLGRRAADRLVNDPLQASVLLAKRQLFLIVGDSSGNIRKFQASVLMHSNHQIHESRSLRMHRMVAELLRQDPHATVCHALGNLDRWQLSGVECDDFEIWRNLLLAGPTDRLFEALISTNEEAVRLRQSSPFAGIVSDDDRQLILSSTR